VKKEPARQEDNKKQGGRVEKKMCSWLSRGNCKRIRYANGGGLLPEERKEESLTFSGRFEEKRREQKKDITGSWVRRGPGPSWGLHAAANRFKGAEGGASNQIGWGAEGNVSWRPGADRGGGFSIICRSEESWIIFCPTDFSDVEKGTEYCRSRPGFDVPCPMAEITESGLANFTYGVLEWGANGKPIGSAVEEMGKEDTRWPIKRGKLLSTSSARISGGGRQ